MLEVSCMLSALDGSPNQLAFQEQKVTGIL